MADVKISELPEATLPLTGAELTPVVQDGVTRRTTVGGVRDVPDWTRPDDWLPLPVAATHQVTMIVAVQDHWSNFAALAVTSVGGYTVDWGDGTVDTLGSGDQAEHTYDWSDPAFDGTETSRGFKQAVVTVTGSGPVTELDLSRAHSGSGYQPTNPWLDVELNVPACTYCLISTYECWANLVERVRFTACGALTVTANMFRYAINLRKVDFVPGMLDVATSAAVMFNGCTALQHVEFPAGSFGAVTSVNGTFWQCNSLREVVIPEGGFAAVTNASVLFSDCYAIERIVLPDGALSVATTADYCFYYCSALRELTLGAGALQAATDVSYCFSFCNSLTELVIPNGALSSAIYATDCFSWMYCLQRLVLPDGALSVAENIDYAFMGLYALERLDLPAGSLGAVTSASDAFVWGGVFARIANLSIPISFSVENNALSSEALDEIYTALPPASATITVTGNPGVGGDDPTIATAKGWTVVS